MSRSRTVLQTTERGHPEYPAEELFQFVELSPAGYSERPLRPLRPLSSPRMKLRMHRLEAVLIDVSVDLRRRDIAVAKQFLHDAQVGPAADQVRRETMPQHVR